MAWIFFDLPLPERLCYLEKLPVDELFENFKLEVIPLKELIGKRPNAEYASIFHSVCKRSLYLKSSLQTRIFMIVPDPDLMGLIDSLIITIGEVIKRCNEYQRMFALPGMLCAIENKVRFLKDFLSNESWQHTDAIEIWTYLLPKIRCTVYCIALFTLAHSYPSLEMKLLDFEDVDTSFAILAIYLLYEIELQEQEIEVVCCDGNLILEGLKGSARMDKKYEDEEIFGAVVKQSSIQVLVSMSNLVHHPQILNIHTELEHLNSFLEDLLKFGIKSLNLKSLLSQIAELNIKTRLMIHKLYVMETTEGMSILMENELPFLIGKAKLIRSEIEKIPPLVQSQKFPLTNGLSFTILIVEKLSNLLSSKIDTIEDNIKLIYELEKSRLLLMEMSKQHTWNDVIDDDLQTQIIQVAYKVEYMVDSIMLNDEDHSNLFPELYNVLNELVMLINKKIATFHDEKKDELSEEITKSRNDKRGERNVLASSQYMTTGEEVVGFEKETEDIVKQLIGGRVELDVISIFGMPGLGKTTLAWKVYHHKDIIGRFDILAWCTVSQNYNKKELLIETYKQVCRPKEDFKLSEDEVADELRKFLIGRRYLIVLDDVWDTKVWDDFSRLLSLNDEKERSRIIITTRLGEVASYAKCHSDPLPLRSLNHEESRNLLLKKIFHRNLLLKKIFQDGDFPEELSSTGEAILGKCDGLPLMIVLVAGVLSRLGPEASEWDKVATNLSSHVASGEDSMKVMELSYKYLPDHLKPCFLYFGAFEEDKQVSVSELIRLWIAEGFVRKNEPRILEDVAKDQLNELISCSLIMVTRRRRCSNEAKACGVHDLVREFCLRKSKEENFMMVIREGDDMDPFIFDHYRLCIELEDSDDSNHIRLSWLRGFHVRSLMLAVWPFNEPPLWIFDSRFKLLRILKLLDVCVCNKELCLGLESLLDLRYLAFGAYGVDKIPSNLLNLETLLVYVEVGSRYSVTLSQTFWRMVHLRHVIISPGWAHSMKYGLEFFEGSSDLENLQSIGTLDISYCEDDDKNILKRFPNLRKLKCNVYTWDNNFPKLDFLCQLESLHMTFYTQIPKLQGNPLPLSLKILKLTSKWSQGNSKCLSWKKISVISTLPNLQELVIHEILEDKVWNVKGCTFTNLRILQLKWLKIAKWIASADSFPVLEELVLFVCKYLKKIPSCFEHIYTLRKIEINSCQNSAVRKKSWNHWDRNSTLSSVEFYTKRMRMRMRMARTGMRMRTKTRARRRRTKTRTRTRATRS